MSGFLRFLKSEKNFKYETASHLVFRLVYLKDSNAVSHFVNSLILFALSGTGILFADALQKYVSNRWYAPALCVCKSQNGSGFNKFFGDVSLCNLFKRVRKSTTWFCGVSKKVPTKSVSEGQSLNKRF